MSDQPNDTGQPHDVTPSSTEETAPLWPQYAGPTTPPPSAPTAVYATAPAPRRGHGLGTIAAAAGIAAIFGAGAGFGGAALYQHDNADTSTPTTSGTSGGTSPIVSSAPPATASTTEKVAAAVLPSVVKIEVQGGQDAGSGSGIILSPDGKILTNNHVVSIAGKTGRIRVDFNDGSYATAKVLGTDPLTDTAVIQASGVSGLRPISIGTSGSLRVGQGVLAIGSPYGLDATVTSGIVSALNRPVDVTQDSNSSSRTVYPAIQTDAAINPGNSGGPLVDLSGRLVGINASIQSTGGSSDSGNVGLGFAIPIDAVLPVVDELENGKPATHAKLGVQVEDVTTSNTLRGSGDTLFGGIGALIQEVGAGSAAGKAGLAKGDVITRVNGQLITSSDGLVATIRAYRPGAKVQVTYLRGNATSTATVTLDSDASAPAS